jgi:thiamine-phosphate pyrophosphorylase
MVQLREKDTPEAEVMRLGRELPAVTRRYGAPLIINGHPSGAKANGAERAHVGREGPPVREVHARLGPDAIIGTSCYGNVTRTVAAEEVKQCVHVPVFAIGGITVDNAQQVIDAGADAIAVVFGVFASADVEAAVHALAQLFAGEQH